jgi:hypothetical protein
MLYRNERLFGMKVIASEAKQRRNLMIQLWIAAAAKAASQ